jgi:hypothetical protein
MLLCARSPSTWVPSARSAGQKVDSHLRKAGMLRPRAWVPSWAVQEDCCAVEVQPGNYMAFFEPWDSGDYDT